MDFFMDYEKNLIVKIAWLYYRENMTQQQISDTLGITRMRVVKYLDKARLMNVVQFQINLDSQKHLDLQRELVDRYHLNDAYIVPSSPNNVNETVAMAAAQYIKNKMEAAPSFTLNIGYGDTVSRSLRYLDISSDQNFSVVSLTGGVSYYIRPQHQYSSQNSTPINAKYHLIPAPLCASTPEAAECFLREPSVRNVMEMSYHANMTILGIGAVSGNATMAREGILSEADISLLQMRGAVGDILSQYYDLRGNRVEFSIHDRLVTTELQTLRKFSNVVCAAGGKEKITSIIGAFNGGYMNVFITDEDTATAILNS